MEPFRHQGETYFQYMGIFDTDFDKYTEDAVSIFAASGLNTVFENLEGFPKDWKTNAPAFIKFVRDHHRPSFLEQAKLTRRQRIRLLTRLNRLTEANSVEAISERSSPAHAELVDILRSLRRPSRRRCAFDSQNGLRVSDAGKGQ
jgi:hypothetical protein